MEQQSPDQSQQSSLFELQVDQPAAENLSSAASWAKFISIVCFIGLGILIITFIAFRNSYIAAFALVLSANTSATGIIIMTIALVFLVVGLLVFFLFKAAVLIKRGIQTSDQQTFNSGLGSLKSYFTTYGIIAILALVLKLIGLIFK